MGEAITAIPGADAKRSAKIADALARDSVFAALPPARLEALAKSGTFFELQKGQRLFSHGDRSDAAYAVLVGEVEIAIPGIDGRPVWLARIGSGAMIGEMGAIDGTPRVTDATATRRCELLRIDRQFILDAMLAEPKATLALLGVLIRRLRETDALVERTSSMELGKRLARFLLIEGVNGRILHNQSELAHHIGASREAVNRKLESWRRQGWVELSRTGLHIRDRAALLAVCKRHAKLHI
ncbi:MAG TPA: Crp/Fnr family transcriptional regulator [Rhizomicrobium sp.]|jgi:CRP/FNR family cyclic AMP-dependent transcriptional regulator|nr:Crp/Fnr family transcriptional regulator [Rhizomicrobium sp.]